MTLKFLLALVMFSPLQNAGAWTISEPDAVTGLVTEKAGKIVGKFKEALPGEYEGAVFLQFRNYTPDGRSKFCTGTLIAPEVVLTAGHCIFNLSSAYSKKDYALYPQEIAVWAGVAVSSALPVGDPRAARIIANGTLVAKWHPAWQGGGAYDAVDMGLILFRPGSAEGITPYALNRQVPETGRQGIIVGYGATGKGKGRVKNIGLTKLRGVNARTINIGGDSSICSGDSGGPLFVENAGRLFVAGVASKTSFDCDTGSGSATRVDTKLDWLDSVLTEWRQTGGTGSSTSLYEYSSCGTSSSLSNSFCNAVSFSGKQPTSSPRRNSYQDTPLNASRILAHVGLKTMPFD